jgi:hypothetical protein
MAVVLLRSDVEGCRHYPRGLAEGRATREAMRARVERRDPLLSRVPPLHPLGSLLPCQDQVREAQ